MKHLSIIIAIAVAAVACDKIGGEGNNECKPLELTTKSAEFVQQGHKFAFEFIDRVDASADKDYIISPLSMQFLLGMVLDGAKGETSDEICDVLGYGKGEKEEVDKYSLSMLEQLPKMDRKTKLSLANALFSDKNFPVLDSYKSNVGKYYKAEIASLDFSSASALKTINGWASKKTNKMIPKVLDSVSPDRPVILMNALYFKGEWTNTFKKSSTSDETFTNEAGVESKVKMMKESSKTYKYLDSDIYQAVSMPYGNGAFSMVVFLPKKGYKVADVIDAVKASDWNSLLQKMQYESLSLWFPKFETKYEIVLNDILSAMGMPKAFNGSLADFSALSNIPLALALVKQDAIIKVDEEGTEAAAVSIAVFEKTSAGGPEFSFHADHPFLYLITESSTGAILFAGKYSNN